MVVLIFVKMVFFFRGERDSNWDSNENIHPLYTNFVFSQAHQAPLTDVYAFLNQPW